MIFGEVLIDDAVDTILAHTTKISDITIKKGQILTHKDIELLKYHNINKITVARLEISDISEDKAALLIATALKTTLVETGNAFTGRCNLISQTKGLMHLDQTKLDRINLINEAITIATLKNNERVNKGQLIATIKIIPFAVPKSVLDKVIDNISSNKIISILPFKKKSVGLILTKLPNTKKNILVKTSETTNARIQQLGSEIIHEIRCNHEQQDVINSIKQCENFGCDVILLIGASAVVDREDVLPRSLVKAGGTVDHFGMPVDPGNLLFFGTVRNKPVIGMPGCARSPKLNGFDWILWRILANKKLNKKEVMLMGGGGLLKEISERGHLRKEERTYHLNMNNYKITGILLAAGASRRMGSQNKLLSDLNGKTMIEVVATELINSKLSHIIVVTGHESEKIKAALTSLDLNFIHNHEYQRGLSTSLKTALEIIPKDTDGIIVCLGDMPLIKAMHIDKLIDAFNPIEGNSICVPVYGRKRGNPIVWSNEYLTQIRSIDGDIGAKNILDEHIEQITEVPMEENAVLFDIDTPEHLDNYKENS
ncbi:MAG: NTP transferase domain-containing protein [Rhodospirillales bacterium]|tara:strand:+ start:1124 stop:2746 length:1623 start_codon:yes stop_codon:yes gene_type:complete